MRSLFVGYLLFLGHLLIRRGDSQLGDVCQNEDFLADCGTDEVIVMTSAQYGRMSMASRCIKQDYGHMGCTENMLREADMLCSGRRKCRIGIPNVEFDRRKSECPVDLKSYFQARYRCLKVVHSPLKTCPSSNHVVLKALEGHLASVWTNETGLGSAMCPYVIEAPPGTVINFTLLDFALNESARHRTYASIKETTPHSVVDVRAGARRQSHVYTSISSWVQVRILVHRSTNSHFVLKYQVIGCPDPITNTNTWSRRDDALVTLGCKNSDETWTIKCENQGWTGRLENCSLAGTRKVVGNEENQSPLSHKMSLILIITIALALGSIILTIGILILKWKRGHPSPYGVYHQQHHQQELKLSGAVSRDPYIDHSLQPPPGAGPADPRDYGYGKENEYAYISDFPPPPPPNYDVSGRSATIEERQMELYKARQCVGPYGTYAHGSEDVKATAATPMGQRKKSTPTVPVPVVGFPPAYYEQDTGRQIDGGRPRAAGGSFKHSGGGGGGETRQMAELPSTTPSAYDHLINTGCMSNHKSV